MAIAMLAVLSLPLLLRQGHRDVAPSSGRRLVIVSPHVPQIREEFGRAFSAWHERVYHEAAFVDWRVPGGTSEIIKQLAAQYNAALASGKIQPDGSCPPGTMSVDLMLGGGSYDHGRLKRHRDVFVMVADPEHPGATKQQLVPMSVPARFSKEQLDAWLGENRIGAEKLYDPDQYWIGTALSSFGIVYNRDVLRRLGLPDTSTFADLADPAYRNSVILADPRQSGSVTTAMDAILSNYGWEEGWRILRAMAANARYFTNSSTKPPIDVSQGEAAAALVIDFYGRGQAQGILSPGQDASGSRVGYIDPVGRTSIDADPGSILRGAPDPELAKRFLEFCLTEEAQALWQFPATRTAAGRDNPVGADGRLMGPDSNVLRRMPIRRSMYEKYGEVMVDKVDPFEVASQVKPAGWRDGIGIMMGAFAIDVSHAQREAWAAIQRVREAGESPGLAAAMEQVFFAWPVTPVYDAKGQVVLSERGIAFTQETFAQVREQWGKRGVRAKQEIAYTQFFRECYRRVIEAERSGVAPTIPGQALPEVGAELGAGAMYERVGTGWAV